jgi:hypothetical protein
MICINENCPLCGIAISYHPVKNYIRDTARLRGGEQRRTGSFSNGTQHAAAPPPEPDQSETDTEETDEAVEAIQKILIEQDGRIKEIKSMIFNNRHFQHNLEWRAKVEKTDFWFDWKNEQVNASARVLDEEEAHSSGDKYLYLIRVHGGFVNFAYAIVSAYQKDQAAEGFYHTEMLGKVVRILKETNGNFGVPQSQTLLSDRDQLSKYGTAAFKIVYHCIAHELGHICYGHVYGPGYGYRATAANIGQEHDADSFACSLIAESSFKEELWRGLIQFMIVQAAIQFVSQKEDPDTHPLYIDRLKAAIGRFPDLARAHRISEKWAEEIVSKLQQWLKP